MVYSYIEFILKNALWTTTKNALEYANLGVVCSIFAVLQILQIFATASQCIFVIHISPICVCSDIAHNIGTELSIYCLWSRACIVIRVQYVNNAYITCSIKAAHFFFNSIQLYQFTYVHQTHTHTRAYAPLTNWEVRCACSLVRRYNKKKNATTPGKARARSQPAGDFDGNQQKTTATNLFTCVRARPFCLCARAGARAPNNRTIFAADFGYGMV